MPTRTGRDVLKALRGDKRIRSASVFLAFEWLWHRADGRPNYITVAAGDLAVENLGCTRRAAQQWLDTLAELGLIDIVDRDRRRGVYFVYVYRPAIGAADDTPRPDPQQRLPFPASDSAEVCAPKPPRAGGCAEVCAPKPPRAGGCAEVCAHKPPPGPPTVEGCAEDSAHKPPRDLPADGGSAEVCAPKPPRESPGGATALAVATPRACEISNLDFNLNLNNTSNRNLNLNLAEIERRVANINFPEGDKPLTDEDRLAFVRRPQTSAPPAPETPAETPPAAESRETAALDAVLAEERRRLGRCEPPLPATIASQVETLQQPSLAETSRRQIDQIKRRIFRELDDPALREPPVQKIANAVDAGQIEWNVVQDVIQRARQKHAAGETPERWIYFVGTFQRMGIIPKKRKPQSPKE